MDLKLQKLRAKGEVHYGQGTQGETLGEHEAALNNVQASLDKAPDAMRLQGSTVEQAVFI